MANIKRLKRLVTVLERVAADPKKAREFDLGIWAKKVPSCGTHRCVVGWGATDRVLRSEGLRLEPFASDAAIFEPVYGGLRNWAATEMFFEIPDIHAQHLFAADAYRSKTSMRPVINRLKKFIKEHSAA